jgi:ATP phosphoribosyltransferase regulatory subunit
MTSAWLLPEHVADVLPAEARRIEELRRRLLDIAAGYGFELVMPPLLEHLESLLTGTGRELDLRTFKLVDQLSGRTLGVRADATPQVARIDAHLLNRAGVARLCYCGPVLHTRPQAPHATREPLQLGAETYGHAGLEADLEVQELALDGLAAAGLGPVVVDLADARILRGVLAGVDPAPTVLAELVTALSTKDAATVERLASAWRPEVQSALRVLPTLYGGLETLERAEQRLPRHPLVASAIADLRWLAEHVRRAHPSVQVGFDLADMGGYAYYSGARFAIYASGVSDALVRGGRYDEVGAVFGRNRPAVGCSLDLKALAACAPAPARRAAIRAPWGEDGGLRAAVRSLRAQGETVVCILPGHEHEAQEFDCDRQLVETAGRWSVQPVRPGAAGASS